MGQVNGFHLGELGHDVATPLLRVKGTYEIVVVPVCNVVGVWCHWLSEIKRTVACINTNCPNCNHGHPRRPLAYCGVLHFRTFADGTAFIPSTLELPMPAGHALGELGKHPVALKRTKAQGPVGIRSVQLREPVPACSAWNFLTGLRRMWRVNQSMQLAFVEPSEWIEIKPTFT